MPNSTPDPLDIALGTNIRNRRRGLGLSQRALGEAVGLTFQQVQKYERGRNRVSFSKLVGISRALNCSVVDLIDGVPGVGTTATVAQSDLLGQPGAIELLDCFANVTPPAHRRAVITLVRDLGREAVDVAPAQDAPRPTMTRWRRHADRRAARA